MSKKSRMEMRALACELTDEEVEAKGRELARLALDSRDADRKSVV